MPGSVRKQMIGERATRLLLFGFLLVILALVIILVYVCLSPAVSVGHRAEDFIKPTLGESGERTNPVIEIIGVYYIETQGPCYLLEVSIMNAPKNLDLTSFTQEIPNLSRDNWQAPYKERFLSNDGTAFYDDQQPWARPPTNDVRLVFFFHYLDLDKPLQTGLGALTLPLPTEKPERLAFITYEVPD